MNTGTLIRFLDWAALTFSWLEDNCLFFNAIADAINEHNEQIRLKTVENCFKLIAKDIEVCTCHDKSDNESEDECEDESEDESKDKSEVVVETVTEVIIENANEDE